MESKQPEALRLAAILGNEFDTYTDTWSAKEAAAELRRLHTENVTLQAGYDAARLEIASLQAKLAAFDSASAVRREQDAARYRWLSRKVGAYLTGVESEPVSLYLFCKNPVFEELVKETHKAIDTAIAAQGGV